MRENFEAGLEGEGLQSRKWLFTYKTSSTIIDDRPVDMLMDFYVPALKLATGYDRVAGYFRSSSLAAASQGFSAFIGKKGKMRLIVGADLEPRDVQAILDGDSQRLTLRLNEELAAYKSWPEETRNGVILLSWMVAHGYLEVRVAFRVHGITNEPLTIDAIDDGYVHEKWFVMRDQFGNCLSGSGTLNESRTALLLNAENLDIHCNWWGTVDRERVNQAELDFEDLWLNRIPHMPVLTLPEAVRKKLIKLADGTKCPAEVNGTSNRVVESKPSSMELLRFAILKDAPLMSGGRFVGMETAPVDPWPHQAIVAKRLIETWPYSYLLCDEVGLGKTIEAGLAFRSLYLSGMAKRIFVAAPASLTRQWHRQMATKMLLSFGLVNTSPQLGHEYIFPVEETRVASSIYDPHLIIMSTGLLARKDRAAALKGAEPFDIALVDEAHAARRKMPTAGLDAHPEYGNLYKSIRDFLRDRALSLWLATATPMQIDPVEACDLIALTNRVGAFQFDPTLTFQYYEILGKLIYDGLANNAQWDFLRRSLLAIPMQDPMLWTFLEGNVIDGRVRTTVRQFLEQGRVPWGDDRKLITKLIYSAAPVSRVMMRHTRQLLDIYREKGQLKQNLAKRHILPVPRIVFNDQEKCAYEQLEEYCEGLSRQISRAGVQSRNTMGFLLSFIRLRFASSLYAIKQTLIRRLIKVEATLHHQIIEGTDNSGEVSLEDMAYEYENEDDDVVVESLLKERTSEDLRWERNHLKYMLDNLHDISGISSKMKKLLDVLDQRRDKKTGRIHQTVIFTRFYDTLTDIVGRLHQAESQMLIGTYSGRGAEYYDIGAQQMVPVDREGVKARFLRGEIDVLICTDAAAEGLNLQTADLLVNFDLGWNPMKVEQRIGRIDRIGQKHDDIYVLNLCYLNSAEEVVYGRLLSRLDKANLFVGTQQISMLPIGPEEFKGLAEGTLELDELEILAHERINNQRERTNTMEIPSQDLYDIYMRMELNPNQWHAPITLSDIWECLTHSEYLAGLGCKASQDTFMVSNIIGIPEGARLTISRELYDKDISSSILKLHFASYGDPIFDALLKHMDSFGLPSCIRRMAIPVTGMKDVEIIGYAVVCRDANNTRRVRLVCSWGDLEGLHLYDGNSVTEAEFKILKEHLKNMVGKEFGHYRRLKRIEHDNLRAAKAQEMLNLLISRSLLRARGSFADEDVLFWLVLKEVCTLFGERESILAPNLPTNLLRDVANDLPFELSIPIIGNEVTLKVPRIMALPALNTVQRIANSMKARKAELLLKSVDNRLKREIRERERKLG